MRFIAIIIIILMCLFFSVDDTCYAETLGLDGEIIIYEIDCDRYTPFAYPIFKWSKFWKICDRINDCYFGYKSKG